MSAPTDDKKSPTYDPTGKEERGGVPGWVWGLVGSIFVIGIVVLLFNMRDSGHTTSHSSVAQAIPSATAPEVQGETVCGTPNPRPEYESQPLAPDQNADPEKYKLKIPHPSGKDNDGHCMVKPDANPAHNGQYGWKCQDYDGTWHTTDDVDMQSGQTYCTGNYKAIMLYKLPAFPELDSVGVKFYEFRH
jgi:hypothetical protein